MRRVSFVLRMMKPTGVLFATLVATSVVADGVRYRGVFINDEDWCLRPWCNLRFGKERGICVEAYREIFDDMKCRARGGNYNRHQSLRTDAPQQLLLE